MWKDNYLQAERNRQFASEVSGKLTGYGDWYIIACHYAALHYTRSVLFAMGPLTHQHRGVQYSGACIDSMNQDLDQKIKILRAQGTKIAKSLGRHGIQGDLLQQFHNSVHLKVEQLLLDSISMRYQCQPAQKNQVEFARRALRDIQQYADQYLVINNLVI